MHYNHDEFVDSRPHHSLQSNNFSDWNDQDRLFFILLAAFSKEYVKRGGVDPLPLKVEATGNVSEADLGKVEKNVYMSCIRGCGPANAIMYEKKLKGSSKEKNKECLRRLWDGPLVDILRFSKLPREEINNINSILTKICDLYCIKNNKEIMSKMFEDVKLPESFQRKIAELELTTLTDVFIHVIKEGHFNELLTPLSELIPVSYLTHSYDELKDKMKKTSLFPVYEKEDDDKKAEVQTDSDALQEQESSSSRSSSPASSEGSTPPLSPR